LRKIAHYLCPSKLFIFPENLSIEEDMPQNPAKTQLSNGLRVKKQCQSYPKIYPQDFFENFFYFLDFKSIYYSSILNFQKQNFISGREIL